jgi:hypothetical protein
MSAPRNGSTDAAAAEGAARTVLRVLAVGDIEIVWVLLHRDYRLTLVEKFLATSSAAELLATYGSGLHRAQFLNLARRGLMSDLGPLPWAEAEGRVGTIDTFAVDDCVVVTFEVADEPDCRWILEMTSTKDGWRLHNLARQ